MLYVFLGDIFLQQNIVKQLCGLYSYAIFWVHLKKRYVDEGDRFGNDKDAYVEENIFFVPKDVRWRTIVSAAHISEFGTAVCMMRAISRKNVCAEC